MTQQNSTEWVQMRITIQWLRKKKNLNFLILPSRLDPMAEGNCPQSLNGIAPVTSIYISPNYPAILAHWYIEIG